MSHHRTLNVPALYLQALDTIQLRICAASWCHTMKLIALHSRWSLLSGSEGNGEERKASFYNLQEQFMKWVTQPSCVVENLAIVILHDNSWFVSSEGDLHGSFSKAIQTWNYLDACVWPSFMQPFRRFKCKSKRQAGHRIELKLLKCAKWLHLRMVSDGPHTNNTNFLDSNWTPHSDFES